MTLKQRIKTYGSLPPEYIAYFLKMNVRVVRTFTSDQLTLCNWFIDRLTELAHRKQNEHAI